MHLAIPPELCGNVPKLLVHEPKETHTTIQSRFSRWIPEHHSIQPIAVLMAPMVVVELLGLLDTEIQQLHLDIALDPAKILYQIVTTTEKTSEFFPFDIGHINTLQPTVP